MFTEVQKRMMNGENKHQKEIFLENRRDYVRFKSLRIKKKKHFKGIKK